MQTLVLYRLIDSGSEWRLHRHWFKHTVIADLLGGDFALAEIHRLYACHDQLVAHKAALFRGEKWKPTLTLWRVISHTLPIFRRGLFVVI